MFHLDGDHMADVRSWLADFDGRYCIPKWNCSWLIFQRDVDAVSFRLTWPHVRYVTMPPSFDLQMTLKVAEDRIFG